MDEYLTLSELCDRIKYQRQTIYNLIHKRRLILGRHFLKPTPRKLLFKWSEMQIWIGERSAQQTPVVEAPQDSPHLPAIVADQERKGIGLIRI